MDAPDFTVAPCAGCPPGVHRGELPGGALWMWVGGNPAAPNRGQVGVGLAHGHAHLLTTLPDGYAEWHELELEGVPLVEACIASGRMKPLLDWLLRNGEESLVAALRLALARPAG